MKRPWQARNSEPLVKKMVYVPLLILRTVVLAWERTYTPIALDRPRTSTITVSWLRRFLIVSLPGRP